MARFVVTATWDDVPHLSEAVKAELRAAIPPHQVDARTRGIPQLGSGAIYPIAESEIAIDDFPIPKHWPRGYAMDAGGGARPTAAVWGAWDREADVVYIYSVYKRPAAEPVVHAEAIKARGAWMKGVGDVAALILTHHDAEQLIATYKRLGLDLALPDKAVETGIFDVWQRLSQGRLRIFRSCRAWFDEFRLYRRDAKGRIVKSNDHLQDSCRYLVRSGLPRFTLPPSEKTESEQRYVMLSGTQSRSWMQ